MLSLSQTRQLSSSVPAISTAASARRREGREGTVRGGEFRSLHDSMPCLPASFDSPAHFSLLLPLLPLPLPLPLSPSPRLPLLPVRPPLSLLGPLSPSPLTFLSLLLHASPSPSPSLPHCRLPLLTTPHPPTSMSQTPRRTSPSLSSPGGQITPSPSTFGLLIQPLLPRVPPLRIPPLYLLHLPPPFLEPLLSRPFPPPLIPAPSP